jgi:hypothetical protein
LLSAAISLDTRFRGYDGTLRLLGVLGIIQSIAHLFSKEGTKEREIWIFINLRELRAFVVNSSLA